MLADQFLEAAKAAPHSRALDDLARLVWRAHGEGHVADAEASAVSEAIGARRAAFSRGEGFRPLPSPGAAGGLPRGARRPPLSPDRQASIDRRRRQMMSGVVPAKLAAHFTPAELAALTVIGREVQRRGTCTLPIDAIAALAGCCRTSVQNALRQARGLGLILVRERRIPGLKSLPNVIRIVAPDWLGWLRLGGGATGFKKLSPTDNSFFSPRGAKGSDRGLKPFQPMIRPHPRP